MREIIADSLEKVFGRNGCMEVVFGTLLKIGLVVTVGYLGLRMLLKNVDSSTSIGHLATATPIISIPTQVSLEINQPPKGDFGNNLNCVEISENVPNAFRGWLALGRPNKVIFLNLAGPDGDPNDQGTRITDEEQDGLINNLPKIVHKGDKFCLP